MDVRMMRVMAPGKPVLARIVRPRELILCRIDYRLLHPANLSAIINCISSQVQLDDQETTAFKQQLAVQIDQIAREEMSL